MAEKDFVKLKNVTKIYQMGEVQMALIFPLIKANL